jgi:hypothetical protein
LASLQVLLSPSSGEAIHPWSGSIGPRASLLRSRPRASSHKEATNNRSVSRPSRASVSEERASLVSFQWGPHTTSRVMWACGPSGGKGRLRCPECSGRCLVRA